MGSVTFSQTQVEIVRGRPEFVNFLAAGIQQFARSADRKGRYAELPDDLRRVHRAMQIAIPPAEFVVAEAGQTDLKATMAIVFGSGQRGPTDTEWHPTSLVEEGARAWVRRQRWQEGGGDNWFGSPIYHDWAVAGAFIRDAEIRQWADKLFEHPLGRLVETESLYRRVYVPAGTDPRSWAGVEIEGEGFSFHDVEDYDVKEGKAQPGVHRAFRAKWGLWSGEISVYLPEYWQMKTDWESEYPVVYPYLVARNGREEQRFAPPYSSLEADQQFIEAGREEGSFNSAVKFITEFPDLPQFVSPTEASGEYATFWPTMAAWQDFARRHNIRGKKPFMYNLDERVPGGVFVPLTREFAEIAWADGGTMLPPIAGKLPVNFQDLPADPGYGRSWPATNRVVPDGPFKGLLVYLGEPAHCQLSGGAWVAAPLGLAVWFGHTIREIGDPTVSKLDETIVYRDGRVRLRQW